jgi:hypothetical protein
VDIPKSTHISDVGDVEKILSMHDINAVLVVDIQILELENTLGSNGIHKCKN